MEQPAVFTLLNLT